MSIHVTRQMSSFTFLIFMTISVTIPTIFFTIFHLVCCVVLLINMWPVKFLNSLALTGRQQFIQFSHYIPWVYVRHHGIGNQFYKMAPHFRCQLQRGYPDSTHFRPTDYKFRVSHNFFLQVWYFTRRAHRTQERHSTSLYWSILKDATQEGPNGGDGQSEVCVGGRGTPWASLTSLGPAQICSHQLINF